MSDVSHVSSAITNSFRQQESHKTQVSFVGHSVVVIPATNAYE